MKIVETIRAKLLQIKASPATVSKGYALGVFLGTTPLIGTKVFIALGLTSFLRWNRIASVIGVYHINILTAPAFYSVAFLVGKWVTGTTLVLQIPSRLNLKSILELFTSSPDILLALTAGGIILGLPLAFIAYYFSYSILRNR
jgi:uncharacterized protein (DUF2062 family)